MKYPKASSYLTFERSGQGKIRVENVLTGKTWVVGMNSARLLKYLDGHTSPYKILADASRKQVDKLVDRLVEEGLVRKKIKESFLAQIVNRLLILSWFPVFLYAVWLAWTRYDSEQMIYPGKWDFPIGILGGMLIGMLAHEFAKICAEHSYGTFRTKMQVAHIKAAGIEMNILLAGIFLICGTLHKEFGYLFFYASFSNIALAVLNKSLSNGMDGIGLLGNYLKYILIEIWRIVSKLLH